MLAYHVLGPGIRFQMSFEKGEQVYILLESLLYVVFIQDVDDYGSL